MKRFLIAIVFAIQSALAQYSYVAGSDWVETGGSTTLVFASQTFAAGEFVAVGITYGNGSAVTESIADGTNTYTKVGSTLTDGSNGQNLALFVVKSAASGSFTITVTFASSVTYRGIMYARYTGLDASQTPTLSGTVNTNVGTGTDAVTSGNVTPGGQPAMIFAFGVEVSGGGSAMTAGTGFTDRGAMANWNSYIGFSRFEDKRVTSTSAVPGTFTVSNGTHSYLVIGMAAYETGAGGGGGSTLGSKQMLLGVGGP